MRPIKFRAWSPLAREMYKVNSLHFDKEGLSEIVVEVFEVNGVIYSSAVARNLELMQFTGFTDQNGQDIYEGDIIKHPPYWHDDREVHAVKDIHMFCGDYGNYGDIETEIEVIGNRYEHPELMREQAQ